jgi:hypothetical protein
MSRSVSGHPLCGEEPYLTGTVPEIGNRWTRRPPVHDNTSVTDRVVFLVSALAALVSVMLLTGGVQAYVSGGSVWWIAWALMLQGATIWQVVRRFRKRRRTEIDER